MAKIDFSLFMEGEFQQKGKMSYHSGAQKKFSL
jgi:hypothetical protein